jgi:hypothetical protein
VQQQLEKSLGGQKLVPGVPLKNQVAAQGAAAGKLPEGFTPVESSALKGYKYDPAAREFEYVTKDGSHYVRGDVDPEAAAQFEKTAAEKDSFGKAWHELRQNPQGGVGVAKVINGKRVPIVKTAPLTDLQQQIKESVPASQAPTGAPLTDLAKQIKQSAKRTVVVDPASGKPEFSDVIEAKQAKPAAEKAARKKISPPDSFWRRQSSKRKRKSRGGAGSRRDSRQRDDYARPGRPGEAMGSRFEKPGCRPRADARHEPGPDRSLDREAHRAL